MALLSASSYKFTRICFQTCLMFRSWRCFVTQILGCKHKLCWPSASKAGKQKMDGIWSHKIFVSSCQANEVLDIAIKLCGNSLIQSRTPLSQRLQQGKHRKWNFPWMISKMFVLNFSSVKSTTIWRIFSGPTSCTASVGWSWTSCSFNFRRCFGSAAGQPGHNETQQRNAKKTSAMIDLNMFAYFSCNGFVGFPVLQDQTDPG